MFDFNTIVTLIVLAPFLAALANGIHLIANESFWDWRTTQRIACGSILVSFVGSLWVFAQVLIDPTPREVIVYSWLVSGDLAVNFAFLIDSLSAVMMLVVSGFSFAIAMFSRNYMHRDFSFTRYFSVVALFVFAMLVLVMGNNFVMLFLGWESVGVCSYLLIGHYYNRTSAARAGTKAFVMNRVGDAGFLIGIFLIFVNLGSVNYTEVFAKASSLDAFTANAIGLCLLLGAIGKSAQLPLGTWLAKAMEGPTPSSALIHAATMVTAGVYMLARAHAIYDMAPAAMAVVVVVGALTAVYGATVGLALTDIKGILAFSTTTQLGLMFVACGLGAYPVAIFHLVAHAFFKSYLFLTAPSILHHFHAFPEPGAIDSRHTPVPVAYWAVLVGSIAIGAYPFLGEAFGVTGARGLNASYYVLLAAAAMALFTAVYFGLTIAHRIFSHGHGGDDHAHGADGHDHGAHAGAHKEPGHFAVPVVSLLVVLLVGYALDVLPGGMEGTWFGSYMAPVVSLSPTVASQSAWGYLAAAAIGLMFVSAWTTALFMGRYQPEVPGTALLKARKLYNLALHRFYIDEFYSRYVVGNAVRLGKLFERFDGEVIDKAVGAPVPAERIGSASATWESRFMAAKAAGVTGALGSLAAPQAAAIDRRVEEETGGMLNWLTRTSASTAGGVESGVVAQGPGFAGRLTDLAARSTQLIEQEMVSRGPGLVGSMTTVAARTSQLFEKGIIGGGSGLIGALTNVAAFISAWVEHNVFDTAITRGVPGSGSSAGRSLNRLEETIAHPLVTGAIVAAGILALIWGAVS